MVLAKEDGLVELPDVPGAGLVAAELITEFNDELTILLGGVLARVAGFLEHGLSLDASLPVELPQLRHR